MNTKTNATNNKNEETKLLGTGKTEKPETALAVQKTVNHALLVPTAEQRLKNLKNFQMLSERYLNLRNKEDELNAFNVSSDGTQEKIKLTNSAGFVFTISNSQVIDDVISIIGKHVETKIKSTEQEILTFTI